MSTGASRDATSASRQQHSLMQSTAGQIAGHLTRVDAVAPTPQADITTRALVCQILAQPTRQKRGMLMRIVAPCSANLTTQRLAETPHTCSMHTGYQRSMRMTCNIGLVHCTREGRKADSTGRVCLTRRQNTQQYTAGTSSSNQQESCSCRS